MIRIKAYLPDGPCKILSLEDSMKMFDILVKTEIAKQAFLAGIKFEYDGVFFKRIDI